MINMIPSILLICSTIEDADALLQKPSTLPAGYRRVLDALASVEFAVAVLRIRQASITVAVVRAFVARNTRHDVPAPVLTQLAVVELEAVAVVNIGHTNGIGADGLLLRIDVPNLRARGYAKD